MTDTNLAKIRLVAYTAVAGMLGLLVVLGYVTKDQSDMILAAVGAVLNVVTAILLAVAVRNITPDSWSRIRGLLYLAEATLMSWRTLLKMLVDATLRASKITTRRP